MELLLKVSNDGVAFKQVVGYLFGKQSHQRRSSQFPTRSSILSLFFPFHHYNQQMQLKSWGGVVIFGID
jgi:hypothetical protein